LDADYWNRTSCLWEWSFIRRVQHSFATDRRLLQAGAI
jgi:hypothetical protein